MPEHISFNFPKCIRTKNLRFLVSSGKYRGIVASFHLTCTLYKCPQTPPPGIAMWDIELMEMGVWLMLYVVSVLMNRSFSFLWGICLSVIAQTIYQWNVEFQFCYVFHHFEAQTFCHVGGLFVIRIITF